MNYHYETDLSWKDLAAILFRRRKRCVACGAQTKRSVQTRYLGESWKNTGSFTKIHMAMVKNYRWTVVYVCTGCKKTHAPHLFW